MFPNPLTAKMPVEKDVKTLMRAGVRPCFGKKFNMSSDAMLKKDSGIKEPLYIKKEVV